ncbi:MAG: hypothetical protein WC718_00150 [Phycisphaerales bacterium]|jgi:hypothetical protein
MTPQDHGYRIGLVKGRGLVSRLISREIRDDKTHGYLLCPQRLTVREVVESVAGPGMRVREWDPAETKTADFYDVGGRTLAQWQSVERLMREWVAMGVKYDYPGILSWRAKLPMSVNGKLFCTEALELADQMAGDPLFRCAPHYISPRDFDINLRLIPRLP